MISTNKETKPIHTKPNTKNSKKLYELMIQDHKNSTEKKEQKDSSEKAEQGKILVFRKIQNTNNGTNTNKKRVISSRPKTGNSEKRAVKRTNENANKNNDNLLVDPNNPKNKAKNVVQKKIFYVNSFTKNKHLHSKSKDLFLSPPKINSKNDKNDANIFRVIKEAFNNNSHSIVLVKNRSFNQKQTKLELLSNNLEVNKKIVRILSSRKSLNLGNNIKYNNTPTKIISDIENFNKKLINNNKNENKKALTPLISNKSAKIIKPKTNNLAAKQSPYLNKRNLVTHKYMVKPNQMTFSGHLEDYIIGKELGKGSYAVVKEGFSKLNSIKVAIKIYDKFSFYDANNRGAVRQEIEVMKQLKHENIVKLYEAIFYQSHIYLVMELVTGISLFEYLKKQKNQRIQEDECKRIYIQIVKAIHHCHIKNISHRDIKLENIILTENNTKVKLIDFGFGCKIIKNAREKFFCGTPSYMPPEIAQKKGYSPQYADIWSLGVLLYLMLYGNFPFKANYEDDLYNLITKGKFECSDIVTEKANNLIQGILKVNPLERPSAEEILQNEWFEGI